MTDNFKAGARPVCANHDQHLLHGSKGGPELANLLLKALNLLLQLHFLAPMALLDGSKALPSCIVFLPAGTYANCHHA